MLPVLGCCVNKCATAAGMATACVPNSSDSYCIGAAFLGLIPR